MGGTRMGGGRTEELMRKDGRFLMQTYSRMPIAVSRGKGTVVVDVEGREYLDFLGGLAVNVLGHCHPKVVEAIERQANSLIHCSNLYYIPAQIELAEKLVGISGFDRVFFCNSGTEANEAALKLARLYAKKRYGPSKFEIVSASNSFHGRTMGSLAMTGQGKYQKGFEPIPPGFGRIGFNDVDSLEGAITERTCAVILEAIQGEGGVHVVTREFMKRVRELCDENGALLIMDEVQCGMGRTGAMFAYSHFGIEPDVVTMAKGLGGGVAIGALLAKEEVAVAFEPGNHASTFGGNPLACSAAIATLDVIEGEGLVRKAAELGSYFMDRLDEVAGRHIAIRGIRGMGLMIGVELEFPGGEIVRDCLERGLLTNCTAERVVRFLPPLTVTREEIDRAVSIFESSISELGRR